MLSVSTRAKANLWERDLINLLSCDCVAKIYSRMNISVTFLNKFEVIEDGNGSQSRSVQVSGCSVWHPVALFP